MASILLVAILGGNAIANTFESGKISTKTDVDKFIEEKAIKEGKSITNLKEEYIEDAVNKEIKEESEELRQRIQNKQRLINEYSQTYEEQETFLDAQIQKHNLLATPLAYRLGLN